jgi:hypothetical protein
MNMVYVASRIDPSRRREALSWSSHAEVASLAPAEQDRWLDRAESERMSVRRLRHAIKQDRHGADGQIACPSCGRFPPEE